MQVMVPLKTESSMTAGVLAAIGMMDAIKQERPSLKIWETETPCGNGRATQVSGCRTYVSTYVACVSAALGPAPETTAGHGAKHSGATCDPFLKLAQVCTPNGIW